jgi:hypothetical protein
MLIGRRPFAVLFFSMVGDVVAASQSREALPDRAIVDAHPIQPRAKQFRGANSRIATRSIHERCQENRPTLSRAHASKPTMRDLKADWRKWTRAEKWAAASLAIATSAVVPVLFLFR